MPLNKETKPNYDIYGGVRGVVVSVQENKVDYPSSNPGRDCMHLTEC